jgi:hypothetical protein
MSLVVAGRKVGSTKFMKTIAISAAQTQSLRCKNTRDGLPPRKADRIFEVFAGNFLRRVDAEFAAAGDFAGGVVGQVRR